MVGTQADKSITIHGPPPHKSNKEIELERKRREDEILARELESAKIDAAIAKKRRKIQFLRASSANVHDPSAAGLGMPSLNTTIPISNATISNLIPHVSTKSFVDPNRLSNENMGGNVDRNNNSSGNTSQRFQRRHMQLEGYRQISFDGILGYPNAFPKDIRDKVPKFLGNNAISCEEHLRLFIDMLNDYEVEHEDVVLKLFVQSLVEDARDWFKRLPDRCIDTWDSFERYFKEQFGDMPNASFMLNEFNTIRKNYNESTAEFNMRF